MPEPDAGASPVVYVHFSWYVPAPVTVLQFAGVMNVLPVGAALVRTSPVGITAPSAMVEKAAAMHLMVVPVVCPVVVKVKLTAVALATEVEKAPLNGVRVLKALAGAAPSPPVKTSKASRITEMRMRLYIYSVNDEITVFLIA